MTVFISIPWFHPAFKAGGPIQSIANLVNKYPDAKFYIYCGNTDLNDSALDVQTENWQRYNDNTAVWYAKREKRSEQLVKQIELIKPDVIFLSSVFSPGTLIWCHCYLVRLRRKLFRCAACCMTGLCHKKKLKKRSFLFLWRFFDWHRKGVFHASDMVEKNYIEKCFGEEIEVNVAGNFARTFVPVSPYKKKGTIKLTSVGLISAMKSHLMVLQSLALVPALIEYNIYGPVKDMQYWQLCLEEMKHLPVNISVQYHGEVNPSEIEAVLHQSHVFILPSKSENFGHAIFEGLTAGKPVITSFTTPWQNLQESRAGMNVSLDVDGIVEAVLHFSEMDNDTFQQWSEGAVQYAKKAVNEESLIKQYKEMFTIEAPGEVITEDGVTAEAQKRRG